MTFSQNHCYSSRDYIFWPLQPRRHSWGLLVNLFHLRCFLLGEPFKIVCRTAIIWSQAVFMVAFPVGPCLRCSVLTSGQAGASPYISQPGPCPHYILLEGGRATDSDEIKALSLNYVCSNPAVPLWSIDFGPFMLATWRLLEDGIRIEGARIMGFYRSTEAAQWKSAAARLWLLEEYWRCRCVCVNLGKAMHFSWHVICEL